MAARMFFVVDIIPWTMNVKQGEVFRVVLLYTAIFCCVFMEFLLKDFFCNGRNYFYS